MARWRSTFVRYDENGTPTQSSRDFVGDNDSAASAAAIRDARFARTVMNNDAPNTRAFIEKIND
jgi:hypothetical protein